MATLGVPYRTSRKETEAYSEAKGESVLGTKVSGRGYEERSGSVG